MKNINIQTDSKTQIKQITTESLITPEYQRRINGPLLRKITTDFQAQLFGVIFVVRRHDGKYAVVDGQHRVEAARRLNIRAVPCIIIENITYEDEAKTFIKLDCNRKNLTPVDVFRASIEAKDEKSLKIKKILSDKGFEISSSTGLKNFSCVKTLLDCLNYGEGFLVSAIEILSHAWWGADGVTDGTLLQGLTFLLRLFSDEEQNFNKPKFIQKLKRTTPRIVLSKAVGLAVSWCGGSRHRQVSKVFLHIYNSNSPNKISIPNLGD